MGIKIDEIVKLLEKYRDAYYNSEPLVSDAEYDGLEDQLRELDPDNAFFKGVGAAPRESGWKKVRHGVPMGSLDKCQNYEEVTKWLETSHAKFSDMRPFCQELVVSEKLDGISISLKYDDGELVQANTRGDGVTGENILRNVKRMEGVPLHIEGFTGHVRGEIVLKRSVHAKYFPEYKNPRNAASGIAKRETDADACQNLTVIAYSGQSSVGKNLTRKSLVFRELERLGFLVPNWFLVTGGSTYCVRGNSKNRKTVKGKSLEFLYDQYIYSDRGRLDYDIDGLVIEFDDLKVMAKLGEHGGRPKGARAFKFPHEHETTVLREIVWQVGKSGRVTPVAFFDTVDVAGVSVSKANLHNLDNINRLAADCPRSLLGRGDKIVVSRRNDVIPHVERVVEHSDGPRLSKPTKCSSCGTKLSRSGVYHVCPNTYGCPAQVSGNVKRWVKKLDIKGWGDALIDALCDEGIVSSPACLYGLDLDQVAATKMSGKRVGNRTARRVLDNLDAKRELPLSTLIGSLGIDLWGRSMTQKIVDAGYDTLDKMRAASADDIASIPGVGETKADAFVRGLEDRETMIDDLIAAGVSVKMQVSDGGDIDINGDLDGVSFCFTGVRDAELAERIVRAGGVVKSSVVKNLSYLVAKDPTSTSGKAKKARAQGTQVISLQDALAMV